MRILQSFALALGFMVLTPSCAPPEAFLNELLQPDSYPTPRFAAPVEDWVEPELESLKEFDHIDPKKEVPREALRKALSFFKANQDRIPNKSYLTVLDFSMHSGQRRFYLINLKTGAVESHYTSHGENSDPDDSGVASRFSNVINSRKSSLGFYLVAETYRGQHGFSVRLDGLSKSNSNVRTRTIVIHPASYVNPSLPKMGLSWGCPALDPRVSRQIINKIAYGSLMLAWIPGYSSSRVHGE